MKNNNLHIVILAAGKGTRMYSSLSKVLHQIAGKPMLLRVIETAQQLNPAKIHVVIGHGKELIQQQIDSDVNWIVQAEQLGTGHALKMALPFLPNDGQTLVLYGDVPLIDQASLQSLLTIKDNEVAILTDILENPFAYGRIKRVNGQIQGIVEEKDASNDEKLITEINTGILLLPNLYLADWLNSIQNANSQAEYYLTDVIQLAVKNQIPVHGITVAHSYLAAGVNNKLQLAELERIFQLNQARQLLIAGITLKDYQRFDLRGQLTHGQDVLIDVNVIFEGNNTLADQVSIGANCYLKNVTIGKNTKIKPFSHLEDCVIGENAQIGPYARLRPEAQLADDVHIGNFVEVKKSTIGQASKVNHLTYIGDTIIGQNSNIGAGTITCNYDGVNKYQTIIGNDCRIGSGTMLVAPINIADKVTTGAGSVITKNCPEGKLVLARARQVVINHWTRPEKKNKD